MSCHIGEARGEGERERERAGGRDREKEREREGVRDREIEREAKYKAIPKTRLYKVLAREGEKSQRRRKQQSVYFSDVYLVLSNNRSSAVTHLSDFMT